MTHRNAPLSVEGRRRLVVRCQTRPIAHVATEWVSHAHVLRNGQRRGSPSSGGSRASSSAAYTEALPDEKAVTAIGFIHRARAWLAAHGITHIQRFVTDNGASYRAKDFAHVLHGARHQFIAPYTPRHNGKVERYHRILAEEFLYARRWTSETQRAEALKVWNIHFNYRRPHSAAAGQPPASRLATGVTSLMAAAPDARRAPAPLGGPAWPLLGGSRTVPMRHVPGRPWWRER